MDTKEIINSLIERGVLISPDLIECIEQIKEIIGTLPDEGPVVLNKDLVKALKTNIKKLDINWTEFESSRALAEKGKESKIYDSFMHIIGMASDEKSKEKIAALLTDIKQEGAVVLENEDEKDETNVVVLKAYNEKPKKREPSDFVEYFKSRYDLMKRLLQTRVELEKLTSISRLREKSLKETVSVIGMVYEKRETKNGNIMLAVEDPTGTINILVNKERTDVYSIAKELCFDETIGVKGVHTNGIMFATAILQPDISVTDRNKKAKDDVYAAFISDIHVGSTHFLEEDFLKFIRWLNGKAGNPLQRNLAKKIKYLFLVGDIVDGVGVYPGQDKNLVLKDITKQYDLLASYLGQIRSDIKMIIAPGNHDALRSDEPQPTLSKDFAASMWTLPNATMVCNPSYVNIHSSKDFEGFNVLLYHGGSFHYYIREIDALRKHDPKNNPSAVWKYLLKRRHLAPAHTSTTYIPETKFDPLAIDMVPDIVVNGDMHKADASQYNGVIIISSGCWQRRTDYEIKRGNNPDPGKVPLLNLKTKEIKMMKFVDE